MAASGLDDFNLTKKEITGSGSAGDEAPTVGGVPESSVTLSLSEGNRLVCVEYPGTISQCGQYAGNYWGVSLQYYADPSRRLELRFRPKDPFCHPVCGNRFPSTNLLLHVKRMLRKGNPKESHINILGVIGTTYKFQGMADFQYLAVHSAKDGSHTSLYNKIILRKPENNEFFEQPVPLFIPPPIFSRLVCAVDYSYRPEIQHKDGYCPPTVSRNNLIGLSRARRPHNAILLNFDDRNVPTDLWVWFGYGPRKTTEAKKYQVLDFRIRCSTKHRYTINDMPVKAKRSTFNYTLPVTLNKASEQLGMGVCGTWGYQLKESLYIFRDGTLPPHRQMFYQLCDLDVFESMAERHRQDSEEEFDERDGWCLSHTSDDL
uniref:Ral transcription factor IIIC subunit 5 n=1 Tax=Hucho hucho TaxID=62062 RepID=A0A4W5PPR6_9TELE